MIGHTRNRSISIWLTASCTRPIPDLAHCSRRRGWAFFLVATSGLKRDKTGLHWKNSNRPLKLTLASAVDPAEPNLPPINVLVPWTSTERHMRAAAVRAFQKNGIVELPHFSSSIDNNFIDPFLHTLLTSAQQAHVRRKPQPAVLSAFI